ncbi:hypothetical protein [Yoonia sp. BS5-3]|uniref:Uncharacterized protein n=1 Tax=Yoonia phaeophyticola TaxID=3137369 RepID=A0ABZ2V079_9RHOB
MPETKSHPDNMKTVGDIFQAGQRPWQWGLRGDEPLWDELVSKLSGVPCPAKLSAFVTIIEQAFEESVGQTIETCGNVYIERFNLGGVVCGPFWRERGIPGLVQKFTSTRGDKYVPDDRHPRWVFNFDWERAERLHNPPEAPDAYIIGEGDTQLRVTITQGLPEIRISQDDQEIILSQDGPPPARLVEALYAAIRRATPYSHFGYPDMTKFGWQPKE